VQKATVAAVTMWYPGFSGRRSLDFESSSYLLLGAPSPLVSAHLLVGSMVVLWHWANTHNRGCLDESDLLALGEASRGGLPQDALGGCILGIGEGRNLKSGVASLVEKGVACRGAVDGRWRDWEREGRLGSGNG